MERLISTDTGEKSASASSGDSGERSPKLGDCPNRPEGGVLAGGCFATAAPPPPRRRRSIGRAGERRGGVALRATRLTRRNRPDPCNKADRRRAAHVASCAARNTFTDTRFDTKNTLVPVTCEGVKCENVAQKKQTFPNSDPRGAA